MRDKLCTVRTAIALIAWSVSMLAQAQITKCVDENGKISYTNSGCVNASAVAYIAIDEAPATDAAPVQRDDVAPSYLAPDATPVHASAWAHRLSAPGKKSPDAETVSEARQAMAAMDRAVASMRTTRVASND